MNKLLKLLLYMTLLAGPGCRTRQDLKTPVSNPQPIVNEIVINDGEALVLIKTTKGDIKIRLFKETPFHRDNFIKLVEKGHYDSLLFHRVIRNFVAQAGDPVSKNAKPGVLLGDGDVGYTVPAEILPQLYHKRGAVGAARESDFISPNRESSGCQFYIVIGKTWNDSLLGVQSKRNDRFLATNNIIRDPANKLFVERYKKNMSIPDSMKALNAELEKLIAEELKQIPPHMYTTEQKKFYQTLGGTPHLDGSYTVFGEVVEGMEIVDLMAQAATDDNNRPLTDIRILKAEILKKP
ncbi:MAG: peptidylprolyl isomerase [Bacteroidia bacterium]|nr:peptidylprolyl isomerase [Bacteroidia bacterium]